MDDHFATTGQGSRLSMRGAVILLVPLVVLLVLIQVVRSRWAAQPPPTRQVLTPAAASAGWGPEFVDSLGRPARINPCVPMTYAVNLAGAPPGALAVVQAAISTVAAASGLRFTYLGLTGDRARLPAQPLSRGDGGSGLLIAWSGARKSPDDGADPSGSTYTRAMSTSDGPVILSADIVINSDRTFAEGGAASHESLRLVLLHELGHAVGLRHVDDSSQVMSPVAHLWLAEYGSGDRLGLRHLGSGGCLSAP